MNAPVTAANDGAPFESILSLASLDGSSTPAETAPEAAEEVPLAEQVISPALDEDVVALDEGDLTEAALDEDALGADLADTLDLELENDPAFTDMVRSAVDKIGGEILFQVEDLPDSGHVAAVSMGDGDGRRFVLVIQPKDGSPVRVEPAEESANPLAALAESYAGLVEAYKKAA